MHETVKKYLSEIKMLHILNVILVFKFIEELFTLKLHLNNRWLKRNENTDMPYVLQNKKVIENLKKGFQPFVYFYYSE